MSKVFIAEFTPRFNLSSLKEYGELFVVFEQNAPVMNTDAAMTRIGDVLNEEFNPEEDYIVFTGNLVLVSFLFAAALSGWQTVKVLIFDARSSKYKERLITSPYEFVND